MTIIIFTTVSIALITFLLWWLWSGQRRLWREQQEQTKRLKDYHPPVGSEGVEDE